MQIELNELGGIESFYQNMTEGSKLYFSESEKIPICAICNQEIAKIEVDFKDRKELVCFECYSAPDYQDLIFKYNAKRKLI
jgi:hypothetical protein